jgi:hypothetical protein
MADLVSVKKQWTLTQVAFDSLLAWLDPERERAGEKYEVIRARLIKVFAYRGCHTPEELADETINRVTRKIDTVAESYDGDPALYFYGVAQMIHLEYLRRKTEPQPPPASHPEDSEQEYQCLDECLIGSRREPRIDPALLHRRVTGQDQQTQTTSRAVWVSANAREDQGSPSTR